MILDVLYFLGCILVGFLIYIFSNRCNKKNARKYKLEQLQTWRKWKKEILLSNNDNRSEYLFERLPLCKISYGRKEFGNNHIDVEMIDGYSMSFFDDFHSNKRYKEAIKWVFKTYIERKSAYDEMLGLNLK